MYKLLFGFLLAFAVGVLCWSSPAMAQKSVRPLHIYSVTEDQVGVFDSTDPGADHFFVVKYGDAFLLLDSTAGQINGHCVRRFHYKGSDGKFRVGIVRCDMLSYEGSTTGWNKRGNPDEEPYERVFQDTLGLGELERVETARTTMAKGRVDATISKFKTRPGYKDIRLGMSRADVEDIALTSSWTFTPNANGSGGDLWVEGADRYYGSAVNLSPDDQSLLEIRCENSDCTYPGAIELSFFGDTLSAIRLKGHTMEKSTAGLAWSWCEEVTAALQVPYGKPARFNKKLDDYDYDQIQHLPPGTYEFSAWTLKNGVSIQVAMVSGDPSQEEPFGSYCLITDGRAEKPTAATPIPEKKSKKTNSGF